MAAVAAAEGTIVCAVSTAQIAELVAAHMVKSGAPKPTIETVSYLGLDGAATEYHVRTAPYTTRCQHWAGVSFAWGARAVYTAAQHKSW